MQCVFQDMKGKRYLGKQITFRVISLDKCKVILYFWTERSLSYPLMDIVII